MEKEEKIWEQDEEEVVGLQGRRTLNSINSNTTFTSNGSGHLQHSSENNGDMCSSLMLPGGAGDDSSMVEQIVADEELKVSDNASVINGSHGEIEAENDGGRENSEKCVYYHNHEGTGLTNGLSLTADSSIGSHSPEKIPVDNRLDVIVQNFDAGKSLSFVSNHQYEKTLKHVTSSTPPPSSSKISLERDGASCNSFSSKEIECADNNVIGESDCQVTDFDVERVLEKQDTHDLYCPNCNSCITRRVILRKRKRKTSGEDVKRNKLETVTESESDAISAGSTRDTTFSLDGNVLPESNNNDQEKQPDIFRCLSCFSIFIPTGNGFKLFQMFRDKSENENTQDPQQMPVVKKKWFSSIFATDKRELLMEQGNVHSADLETDKIEVLSSLNLNEKNTEASSIYIVASSSQTFKDGELVKSGIIRNQESGDNSLPSSTKGPTELKKPMVNIGERSGRAPLEQSEDTSSHLDVSRFSKDMLPNHEITPKTTSTGKTQVHGGDPTENATFIPQQDVLKFPIPSKVVFSTYENSKTYQNVDAVLEKTSSDKAYPSEVSQHDISRSKLDIVTEGPLKVNGVQDTLLLQEEHFDIGKDTIIVVEAEQIKPAAAQRVQNTAVSAESGDSPHINTQIHVVEQRSTLTRGVQGLDIIKSIVYGGLIESITSLGVVSSAVGAETSTLNVFALALANLIGGLIVIGHDLWELKANQLAEQVDRYQELLGRRSDFLLHAVVAVLSFLVFGLIPPAIYGFSFRKSNDRDLKLLAVAGASLVCITMLSAAKAYIKRPPPSYTKTIVYYFVIGFTVSGVSYAVGNLVNNILEKLGLFQSSLVVTPPLSEGGSTTPAWTSY